MAGRSRTHSCRSVSVIDGWTRLVMGIVMGVMVALVVMVVACVQFMVLGE